MGGSWAEQRAKRGTTFTYSLPEAARVVFTIEMRPTGRVAGLRCVKQTKRNRARSCTILAKIGSFAQDGVAA